MRTACYIWIHVFMLHSIKIWNRESQNPIISYITIIKCNFVETSILCDNIQRAHKICELQADISLKIETNFITLIYLLVGVEVKHLLTLGQKHLPYLYPHGKLPSGQVPLIRSSIFQYTVSILQWPRDNIKEDRRRNHLTWKKKIHWLLTWL